MEWLAKVIAQNGGKGHVKPNKQAWKGCADSLMAEMKQSLHCGHLNR